MNSFQFVTIRYTVNVSTIKDSGLLSVLAGWLARTGAMINVSTMIVIDSLSVSRVLGWLAVVCGGSVLTFQQ